MFNTEINNLPQNEITQRKNKLKELINNSFLKFVLLVSKQLGEVFINEYQTPPEKIITIANVANDCFIEKKINNNNSKNKIIIFAAATWQDSKDPQLFFNMLKRIQKNEKETYLKLVINWAGEGKYLDEVKLFVRSELPDLKINFLGRINKTTIAEQMSQSHFFVHPTIAENLPCIIIESLCVGLPVLTANVNGCKELIDASNGILYQAKDINHLYLKFLQMVENLSAFDNKKIAFYARKKYSASAIGEQIIEVYNKILS